MITVIIFITGIISQLLGFSIKHLLIIFAGFYFSPISGIISLPWRNIVDQTVISASLLSIHTNDGFSPDCGDATPRPLTPMVHWQLPHILTEDADGEKLEEMEDEEGNALQQSQYLLHQVQKEHLQGNRGTVDQDPSPHLQPQSQSQSQPQSQSHSYTRPVFSLPED